MNPVIKIQTYYVLKNNYPENTEDPDQPKPDDQDMHCLTCSSCYVYMRATSNILLDFSLTVKAAPHECVIRTSQP